MKREVQRWRMELQPRDGPGGVAQNFREPSALHTHLFALEAGAETGREPNMIFQNSHLESDNQIEQKTVAAVRVAGSFTFSEQTAAV